ncbi:MAG TPA: 3'(2'),5'-bisphosphate nucleotidase CysQ [Bdellovibrionales bacterium]|nr:3'(2'),5'-bisphosphate nucleotidase CysQ [Bdellovibrionales bacterium]
MALLENIIEIMKEACAIVKTAYEAPEQLHTAKADGSPVTAADMLSHEFLVGELAKLERIPVVSEESDAHDTKNASRYWCVDPLDGTKGFVSRSGDFSINVAIIENERAVFGCIGRPLTGDIYWASRGEGAFKNGAAIRNERAGAGELTALTSSSHLKEGDLELLRAFGIGKRVAMGSALKFGLLAEGAADLYVRFGPTMFWDTAAGQILVEEAGCRMLELESRRPMSYPPSRQMKNEGFVVFRSSLQFDFSLLETARRARLQRPPGQ